MLSGDDSSNASTVSQSLSALPVYLACFNTSDLPESSFSSALASEAFRAEDQAQLRIDLRSGSAPSGQAGLRGVQRASFARSPLGQNTRDSSESLPVGLSGCAAPPGSYCGGPGLQAVKCPPGSYCPEGGMTSPNPCPAGFYSDEAGAATAKLASVRTVYKGPELSFEL